MPCGLHTNMSIDDNVDTIVWSMIELTCIIVCGSLPPMRPWFGKLIPSIEAMKSVPWIGARSVGRTNHSNMVTDKSRTNGYPEDNESAAPTSDQYPLKPVDHNSIWNEP